MPTPAHHPSFPLEEAAQPAGFLHPFAAGNFAHARGRKLLILMQINDSQIARITRAMRDMASVMARGRRTARGRHHY